MNIIFTRPLIDSEDLMSNFISSEHKIIHMPTLSIKSSNMKPINTKDYDGLIFTSANAVRFLKIENEDVQIVKGKENNRHLYCDLDLRLLKRILHKKAHWNNAEIGSHIKYFRSPDIYERGLFYCLNFFHQ